MESLVADSLSADRVLLLGGSGWLGQTVQSLLPDVPVLATASSARDQYRSWDFPAIRDFAPTVVVNCAFLTPGHEAGMGPHSYEMTNRSLTEQFVAASSLPSVRAVVTVSSGAAVTDPQGTYGRLKAQEEQHGAELVTQRRSVVIARAYSLSGPYVRDPRAYALSDFILQAVTGRVEVRAQRPVWRRYTLAADFLQVSLRRALDGWSGVIDSGGELIEIADLARSVAHLVNPDATVTRPEAGLAGAQIYASDDHSWRGACADLGFSPAELPEQIMATAQDLLGRRID